MGNTASGSQTLFDVQHKVNAIASNVCGSWICCINIFTRFQFFNTLLKDYWFLAPTVDCLKTFFMMYFCAASCCLCFVRIGCILNLTLMEEKLGEKLIKKISCSVSFVIAIGTTLYLLLKGQNMSGMLSLIAENKTHNVASKFE